MTERRIARGSGHRHGERDGLQAAAGAPLRALPERAAYALFDRVAAVALRRDGKGVQRLRANYARARPELSPGASSTTSCAPACAPTCATTARPSACRACPLTDIQRGRARRGRRGAAGAVGRRGSRSSSSSATSATSTSPRRGRRASIAPVTTVAERLKPEEVYQEFLAFRRSIGMNIIPLTGGEDPFAEARARHPRGRPARRPGERPRPHPQRRRGRPARPPGPDGEGTGRAVAARPARHSSPRRSTTSRVAGGEGLGGHRTVIQLQRAV